MIGLEDEKILDECQNKIVDYVSELEKTYDIRTIIACLVKISAHNTSMLVKAEHPLGYLLAMAWEQQVGPLEDIVTEPDKETQVKIDQMDAILQKKEKKGEEK